MWIFGVYLNHTFFESIIFPASRKHARRCSVSRKSMKLCQGVTPRYLKTVSQQVVVCRIRTHSLRFLSPNIAFLVGIIQIHTNFGCLKWLVKMVKSPKIFVSGKWNIIQMLADLTSRGFKSWKYMNRAPLGTCIIYIF